MGKHESATPGKRPDAVIAVTLRKIRRAAKRHRAIADEWSRIAPDTITAAGFAAISKQMCRLLRTTANTLESHANLIEALAKNNNANVRRNSQGDCRSID